MTDKINVSETFVSHQGEGQSQGKLSVFLRLQGCDFLCSFCDTIEVWKKGKLMTFEELYNYWHNIGAIDALENGANLIITGGNPLLRSKEIVAFLKHTSFVQRYIHYRGDIEIEIQGNMKPDELLVPYIGMYNVSPKLSNSGMAKEKRIVPEAMKHYAQTWMQSIFKFVIDKPSDIDEMVEDYIKPFNIKPHKVWLMPQAMTKKELDKKILWIAKIAVKNHWNVSNRMQVQIYDKTTGV